MEYGKRLGLYSASQGDAGFTLVELLLALFLFALIAGVIFAAFAAVAVGLRKANRYGTISCRTGGTAVHGQAVAAAMPLRQERRLEVTWASRQKKGGR
jgi:prepilin-type N-terminal cleavage/methylation domain-containing protein